MNFFLLGTYSWILTYTLIFLAVFVWPMSQIHTFYTLGTKWSAFWPNPGDLDC